MVTDMQKARETLAESLQRHQIVYTLRRNRSPWIIEDPDDHEYVETNKHVVNVLIGAYITRPGCRLATPGIEDISLLVSRALDIEWDDEHEGLALYGINLDVGADLTQNLSQAVFGETYALRHQWL
jgi:hypothetical protein